MAIVESDFWRGRRVLITGHTGFIGSWLCLWLADLGAEVYGYSLPPPTSPSLFGEAQIAELLASTMDGDVRDHDSFASNLRNVNPEIVIHLAAQPIVRRGVAEPRLTWDTNVGGTLNLLEAVRTGHRPRVIQVFTSDKCYSQSGVAHAFRESDPLGGNDPYSGSKAGAELLVAAWRRTYFPGADQPSISTVRAGNVIGGGDWADERLIPDCVRALSSRQPIALRNPSAIRPWQHVLEPIAGLCQLAQRQWTQPQSYAEAFNFGPSADDHLAVSEIVERFITLWGDGHWVATADDANVECQRLQIDATKSTSRLGWRPAWNIQQTVAKTAEWYTRRHHQADRFDARTACREQIAEFCRR